MVTGGSPNYLTLDDLHRAAAQALGLELTTARSMTNGTLAGSAVAAPSAGFGGHEQYPEFATKAAGLMRAVASNHALPDGNKRTALLCSILFANLNGYIWEPPAGDDPDGEETAEVVEACSTRSVPLAALAAWIDLRLIPVPPRLPQSLSTRPPLVIYPAEFVGGLPYGENTIQIGDIVVRDIHGYNPAGVYVRRISGKTEGISVAEIIVTVVGDGYAQEELEAENSEAQMYQHIIYRFGVRLTAHSGGCSDNNPGKWGAETGITDGSNRGLSSLVLQEMVVVWASSSVVPTQTVGRPRRSASPVP